MRSRTSHLKPVRTRMANPVYRTPANILLFLTLLLPSCKEPFPPYSEPAEVLRAELQLSSPDTVELYFEPMLQQYFLVTPASMKILVTNIHDDLLSGPANVHARVMLQSFAQIPRTLHVEMARGDLRRPSLFQGNLALPPGASAEFTKLWIPYATDGSLVFEGLPFVVHGGKRYYGPVTFLAHAEAQLFDRVQSIRSLQIQFALWFAVAGAE